MERLLRSVVTRWFRPITALPIKRLIRSATRAVGLLLVIQPVSAGLRLIPQTEISSLRPRQVCSGQPTGPRLGISLALREHPEALGTSRRSRSTPPATSTRLRSEEHTSELQ